MLHLLNGPQTPGTGRGFWGTAALVLLLALLYPLLADSYTVGNTAYLMIWVFMAMGLCLVWGYGGMMSFAQTLFFGIAGYGYGVLAINFGGEGFSSVYALVLALMVAVLAAAVLGYFLIWGGVGGVFFGIVTLSATLKALSIGLVVESVLRKSSGTPKRTTVSVSSSPSSRLAAAAELICRSHFTVAASSVRAWVALVSW